MMNWTENNDALSPTAIGRSIQRYTPTKYITPTKSDTSSSNNNNNNHGTPGNGENCTPNTTNMNRGTPGGEKCTGCCNTTGCTFLAARRPVEIRNLAAKREIRQYKKQCWEREQEFNVVPFRAIEPPRECLVEVMDEIKELNQQKRQSNLIVTAMVQLAASTSRPQFQYTRTVAEKNRDKKMNRRLRREQEARRLQEMEEKKAEAERRRLENMKKGGWEQGEVYVNPHRRCHNARKQDAAIHTFRPRIKKSIPDFTEQHKIMRETIRDAVEDNRSLTVPEPFKLSKCKTAPPQNSPVKEERSKEGPPLIRTKQRAEKWKKRLAERAIEEQQTAANEHERQNKHAAAKLEAQGRDHSLISKTRLVGQTHRVGVRPEQPKSISLLHQRIQLAEWREAEKAKQKAYDARLKDIYGRVKHQALLIERGPSSRDREAVKARMAAIASTANALLRSGLRQEELPLYFPDKNDQILLAKVELESAMAMASRQ